MLCTALLELTTACRETFRFRVQADCASVCRQQWCLRLGGPAETKVVSSEKWILQKYETLKFPDNGSTT
jgi:hypothetical protein